MGSSNNKLTTVPISTTKGDTLVSNGANVGYARMSFTNSNAGVNLQLTNSTLLGSGGVSIALPAAASNLSGIVTATTQTFTGKKTFDTAAVFKKGITISATGLAVTKGGVTVTDGGVTVTAGGLNVKAGGATIGKGDLNVAENADIAGTLDVGGKLTASNGIDVSGKLEISQLVAKSGNFVVGTEFPSNPADGQLFLKLVE